jgi:RNA polymerase sigma-70 factor (ECF subfamily)
VQEPKTLIDHLFRHESGKLVAILTRLFGPHNLELAEDVVQDTLLKALEHWKYHGTPDNPSAWLFTAARNKAVDVLRRERQRKNISPDDNIGSGDSENFVNDQPIEDEQLRMMFVCCHPTIPEEGQVALILKTLCGFSVAEIAKSFLTNEETITKRLYRARQVFREEKVAFAFPSQTEMQQRLSNVLTAVYLIFTEGYQSTHHDSVVREDLVEESLRLGKMITEHSLTSTPESNALMALLCFQTARLAARVDHAGHLLPLKEQDRSLWNQELIEQGNRYLNMASVGETISAYHLQAAIAQEHCAARRYEETNWKRILQWYNWLLEIKPDGLITLNRLIAYAEVHGAQAALDELMQHPERDKLARYYLYPAVLGEWHLQLGHEPEARHYLEMAINATASRAEKHLLQNKLNRLSRVG